MRPIFLATVLLSCATATFTTCGTSSANLPITELYADPPGIVAADQPVTFRLGFTVPEGGSIPSGLVELTTSWNGIPMPVQRSSLASYFPLPLQPGSHSFNKTIIFPASVWGRVNTQLNVYNETGAQLLCAQWTVLATGNAKNETYWPFSALFTV